MADRKVEYATLVSLSETAAETPESARTLRVWIGGDAPHSGLVVSRSVIGRRLLNSVHTGAVTVDLLDGTFNSARLERDNPFLDPDELAKLDSEGVVPIGQQVREGDVLLSVVEVDKTARPGAKGMQSVRDRSERVPAGWDGAIVLSVKRRGRRELGRKVPRELKQRIEVTLSVEHELSAGDLLYADGQLLGIVSRIVSDADMPTINGKVADLVVSQETAADLRLDEGLHDLQVSKSVLLGMFHAEPRTVGPYSLISRRPLGRRLHPTLGTPVTAEPAEITEKHVRWLRERGLNHSLAELITLKSDDVVGRQAVRGVDLEELGTKTLLPSTPNSLYVLRAELMSLGLMVECRGGPHVTIELKPATHDELLACSNGPILRPDTLNFRTLEPELGGLMCSEVFGESYQFGHVELPVPIVPYLWRHGRPSLLETLLGLSPEQIEQLVYYQSYVRRDASGLQWRATDGDPPQETEEWVTGGDAVRLLLMDLPRASLPDTISERVAALVQDLVLLQPVYLRPIVLLDSGNFATSDLNDLYRQIINRSNRLRKLVELNAPPAILLNEGRELQQSADRLWANCLLPQESQIVFESSKPLIDLTHLVSSSIVGATAKRVDWSGRARAVTDNQLGPSQVGIPQRMFESLKLRSEDAVLLASSRSAPISAARPTPTDGFVIRIAPSQFSQLGFADVPIPICDVHRPLGSKAKREAHELMSQVPAVTTELGSHPLIDAVDFEQAVEELVRACSGGGPIALDSPRGLLMAGLGVVEFLDSKSKYPPAQEEDQRMEIPVPTVPPRHHAVVSVEKIREIVQSYQRKACIFKVSKSTDVLVPDAGRIGGLPCLPDDTEWPTAFDRPLPFLAQLPLDPLSKLDDNNPVFPPGSLLTIFWADDWWSSQGAMEFGPIFTVAGPKLVAREAPGKDLLMAQCALVPKIVDEVPCWNEMLEILEIELGDPDPKTIKKFHESEWDHYSESRIATKIGGWPHWIQSPESERPLVAQLHSEEDSDIMLGDCGSLYIFQNDDGSLFAHMQCY